jgi:plastocyanin
MSQKDRRLRLAAVFVAAVGLLAACGGTSHKAGASAGLKPGSGQSLAGSPGAAATAPATPNMPGMTGMPSSPSQGTTAPAGGNAVAIKNFAFAPAALRVRAGTTVTWTNQDGDAHTVTSQGQGPLHSAALQTGATFSYTFTTAGTFKYFCSIHPFMTATVTVTP